MNAVTYAIKNVGFHIPREILNLGLMDTERYGFIASSLETMIHDLIVRPRVLIDCNLVGGMQIIVPLIKCKILKNDLVGTVLEVPKKLTNGRSIMSCDSIVSSGNVITSREDNQIDTSQQFSKMLDNTSGISVIQSADITLVGDNRVFINYQQINITDMYLKVIVEHDSNMSNLQPRSYPAFAKLVLYAVKAYIFNSLQVSLGKGYIYQGHELSVVRDIIDKYEDANNDYQEYLTIVFEKILFMSDDTRMGSYISSMFPNTI